ncbi:hypothetical protein EUTSA_v10015234mg [Eutrema salsugineum]|uniref:Uncharacterized protein n=1 Tax=Eutrema salsugineum TaxID=72664 RepID=V4LDG4_EUTSA|nr:hypothetical protein EUTSA_v10015234mg [Eutrema salsugineum]
MMRQIRKLSRNLTSSMRDTIMKRRTLIHLIISDMSFGKTILCWTTEKPGLVERACWLVYRF